MTCCQMPCCCGASSSSTTIMLCSCCVDAQPDALLLWGPALTAALCSAGLPVGLQLIGKPWHEADLLHASAVIEGARADSMRPPQVYLDVLNQATPTYI